MLVLLVEYFGGKNNFGCYYWCFDLYSNDWVDFGELFVEIWGDCGGDMFDDLGVMFGVCDELNL